MTARMFQNLRITPLMGRVTFDIMDTDLAIVNALRRTLLADIPTVGFVGESEPTVEIQKNTGPLHNEIMIHRIGMIPLHLTEEEQENFQDGLYEFTLSAENTKDSTINITTHDFKGTRDGKDLTEKELRRIFPVHSISGDPILITRLRPKETLQLTAKPIRATAKHHASFSPISMCSLRFLPDPAEAEKVEGVLEKERAYLRNEYNEPTAIEFSFEIENGRAMEDEDAARYMMNKALDTLLQRVDRVIHHEDEHVTCKEIENGFEFIFENEDDTLGNLLQSLMFQRHVREGKPYRDVKVSYVGYVCPHPLDPTMILRVMLAEKTIHDISFAWSLLVDNATAIHIKLTDMSRQWNEFLQPRKKAV